MTDITDEKWIENFWRPAEENAQDMAKFLNVDSIEEMSALEVLDKIADQWRYLLERELGERRKK